MKLFLVVSYLEFQDIKTTQELPHNKKLQLRQILQGIFMNITLTMYVCRFKQVLTDFNRF